MGCGRGRGVAGYPGVHNNYPSLDLGKGMGRCCPTEWGRVEGVWDRVGGGVGRWVGAREASGWGWALQLS